MALQANDAKRFRPGPAAMSAFAAVGDTANVKTCTDLRVIFAPFLVAWIFSGFLSMDDGWLLPRNDDLFRVLNMLDFPPLASRKWLRSSAIIGLCLCGLAFSVTGAVLAWQLLWNGSRNNIDLRRD